MSSIQQCNPGSLYVVATPIGNLADITERALATLKSVDLILAEDTRVTQNLLSRFHLHQKTMAYHAHSDNAKDDAIIQRLQQGESIALVSDAGTPLISDPGFPLVQKAIQAGIRLTPIPGACALIAALCASGLPTHHFYFEGFLPNKSVARRTRLEALSSQAGTLIFYEAPHRILETLEDSIAVLGHHREAVLAREVTKVFETFLRGTLLDVKNQVQADSNQQRGECILLIAGATADNDIHFEKALVLAKRLREALPLKQACDIAANTFDVSKRDLYNRIVEEEK